MKLRNLAKMIIKRNVNFFSNEQKKGGITGFIKSAWNQTFPDEENDVKAKFQKVKEQKRYSKEQLEKIQTETPDYLRGALVDSKQEVKEESKGFKISSLIPESIKNKIENTQQYKQYSEFKENLKEYASTREGVVANIGSTVYGHVAQGSNEARATEIMRQYIKDFNIYELERDSTVIFKDAYHMFLKQKISELELMCSDQALEFFSAHIKMNRTKKIKPKFTQVIFNYPSQLSKAKLGEKQLPSFNFTLKLIQIYCMIDKEEVIVDGDQGRVHESIFDFELIYSGENVDTQGHPWQIIRVEKIQDQKMLV